MASFLIAVAGFVLTLLALGLVCVLRGPAAADRMMSAQLLGTSGIAALLLLSAAIGDPGDRGCRAGACAACRLRIGRVRDDFQTFAIG